MSLKVKLFKDFELINPIWVASSHLTESPKVLQYWQKIAPSAVTLKTTSQKGGTGEGSRVLQRIGREDSLYSNGEKRKELLDYDSSHKLLQIARKLLPHSKVGSSLLMGEDYGRCLSILKESDFFELNLKYAVRSRPSRDIQSKFETDKLLFETIRGEIQSFLEVFADYPRFIKFTREIDWIGDYPEFREIIELVKQHAKTGVILANTKKWIIPSSSSGLAIELKGGIVAGHELFQETYNIVKSVEPIIPDNIPIIATGGIDTIHSVIDIFKAGARIVQLCTAFQLRGLNYYKHLVKELNSIQRQLRVKSFDELVTKVQDAEIVCLPSLYDCHPSFYDYESFDDLFESDRLDMIIVYGRTFTRTNLQRFIARFSSPKKVTRIITMAPNSPSLEATACSLGREKGEMGQKISDMQQYWVRLYKENGVADHCFEIYQHNKVPFHSGYITEDRALFVPYSLLGEEQTLPIYDFEASTLEYKRLTEEFMGLMNTSKKVFSSLDQ